MRPFSSAVGVVARIEIFCPLTGSSPIAGENGSAARTASSCGVGGGGASAVMWPTVLFGVGASSVRIGGGWRTAGCGGVVAVVFTCAAVAGAGRGGGGDCLQAAARARKKRQRFMLDPSQHPVPAGFEAPPGHPFVRARL